MSGFWQENESVRLLRIRDGETQRAQERGTNVPGWVARRLQEAGFDVSREIVYRYDAVALETLFVQYMDDVYSGTCAAQEFGYATHD